MPLMEWKDSFELGVDPMDHTHREFVALVNQMADAPDCQLLAEVDGFIEHTREHFEQERRWMVETDFPPIHCHTEEHDRVMTVVLDVRERLAAGDVELARTMVKELSPWFAQHAATMDSALAWFMQQEEGKRPAEATCGCG